MLQSFKLHVKEKYNNRSLVLSKTTTDAKTMHVANEMKSKLSDIKNNCKLMNSSLNKCNKLPAPT